MPNSTCDRASLLLSANDGDAITVAAHATRKITCTFIGGSAPLYRTPRANRASHVPWMTLENDRISRDRGSAIYETWSWVSPTCRGREPEYNAIRRSSPAQTREAPTSFCVWGRRDRAASRCGHDR